MSGTFMFLKWSWDKHTMFLETIKALTSFHLALIRTNLAIILTVDFNHCLINANVLSNISKCSMMQKLHPPDSKPAWYRDSKNEKKTSLYHQVMAKLQVLSPCIIILAVKLSAHVNTCGNNVFQEVFCFWRARGTNMQCF